MNPSGYTTYTNGGTSTFQVPTLDQLAKWSAQFEAERKQLDAGLIEGLKKMVAQSSVFSVAISLRVPMHVLTALVDGTETVVPGWFWERCQQACRERAWKPLGVE